MWGSGIHGAAVYQWLLGVAFLGVKERSCQTNSIALFATIHVSQVRPMSVPELLPPMLRILPEGKQRVHFAKGTLDLRNQTVRMPLGMQRFASGAQLQLDVLFS